MLSRLGECVQVEGPWRVFEMKALKIDPSLIKPDEAEILEDLILAAHNDAKNKVEAIMQEKTKALTAGLPIPPGMKLPF